MKNSRDPLSDALRRWHVTPPSDPNFRAAIWARIHTAAARESWPAFVRAHAVAWAVVAGLSAGAAGYAGRAAAHARMESDRDAIATRYLVSIDPRTQASLKP